MCPDSYRDRFSKFPSMPKILRIINRFNLGGPTYNAAYLTKYLAPEFETLLVGGMKDDSEGSSEFILKDMGIDYKILQQMKRSINPFNDLSAYNEIRKLIRDFKPDIVHTHAAKAGALGRQAAFSCGVPVTVHTYHGHVFHSYFGNFKTSVYKTIERGLAKKTSAIIAISEKQKQELVYEHHIASADKVHVIPLGFDLNRFRENYDEKRRKFRLQYDLKEDVTAIGIVGRLVPVKNHQMFLEGIKFLTERSKKQIKAFIIGDGESRVTIEARMTELGLENYVIFTSWIRNVDEVYPGLDIVCLTSFNEGTPVSLIEAQAVGKPVVSTRVGGIENVVMPGKTALLSESNDNTLFCQNLLLLVENVDLQIEFSKNGWNYVGEKFHYTRLISEISGLYRSLLR